MRLAGESIDDYVKRLPESALSDYIAIKATADALYDRLKIHVHEHGVLRGRTGQSVMRKIKKKLKSLNGHRAAHILGEAGIDTISVARLKIDEDSIKKALGVTEGNRVLKTLREAGCYDERTIEYYGIKA